jgi:hypothetical protein
MSNLPLHCMLHVADVIGIINSEDVVIAYDTDSKTFKVVTRESLDVRELGYVLVLDPDEIGAVSDLRGLTDRQMERELEATIAALNKALHDPDQRATTFPELDEALR